MLKKLMIVVNVYTLVMMFIFLSFASLVKAEEYQLQHLQPEIALSLLVEVQTHPNGVRSLNPKSHISMHIEKRDGKIIDGHMIVISDRGKNIQWVDKTQDIDLWELQSQEGNFVLVFLDHENGLRYEIPFSDPR